MKSESPESLALPHVRRLHAYTPGLQPTDEGWIKLNTNENPYPPSPRVREAILSVAEDLYRLYPDPRSRGLREIIARTHGLTSAEVFVGNGSDDVLNLLVRAFGGADHGTGFTVPSYSLYPVLVGIENGRTFTVDFDRSLALPVDAITGSEAGLFFLTSPNAPTGVGFTTAAIESVLKRFRGVLVVDEAYADFAEENATSLLGRYPNLVITRTLSKSYSLAGMRVGYALADPSVISMLDRVKDSYNVSRLSQVAAAAALGDQDYYFALTQKIKYTRDYYLGELAGYGWFTYPSQANFLFTEPKTRSGTTGPDVAKGLYEFLLSRKILVRYFPSHALTSSFLRISVGDESQMLTLNEAIQSWLKNA